MSRFKRFIPFTELRSEMVKLRGAFRSIPKSHREFAMWSFFSTISSTTQSVMANHSMLNCIGQDSAGALVTSSFIGKDLFGQIGGISYLLCTSKGVDNDPEKNLKKMAIIQQLAFVAESMTPLLPCSYFLPVASVSNIAVNVSYIGFGSLNTQVLEKLSNGNIGEMYTHLSIINTIGSSIGMCIGMCITHILPDHGMRLLVTPVFGAIRVFSVYKAFGFLKKK